MVSPTVGFVKGSNGVGQGVGELAGLQDSLPDLADMIRLASEGLAGAVTRSRQDDPEVEMVPGYLDGREQIRIVRDEKRCSTGSREGIEEEVAGQVDVRPFLLGLKHPDEA